MKTTTVLLVGVGGQGTISAADILARAIMGAGMQVKISEIHGMSQRGGSVTTVVRFGPEVKSMVSDLGAADVIVSFEVTEALRAIPQLSENGSMIVNAEEIKPLTALTGRVPMPENAEGYLNDMGALLLPANEIALKAGNPKTMNVVLLGALSKRLDIPTEVWEEAISGRVPPKTIEANLAAFHAGREYIASIEA
ncbi:MAG: indolepyruvate oxidoreductase subunit beta [Eggerthellaceae bacterium]|nr:indolepyruvate oxidoreductase subunit beta [Eggerthellaceae bacterium]